MRAKRARSAKQRALHATRWLAFGAVIAVFAGPLTALILAPFRGGSLAVKGRVCE